MFYENPHSASHIKELPIMPEKIIKAPQEQNCEKEG
jgi:hypothetical protein